MGDKPYYTRSALTHDFDLSNYTTQKVRNDVNYLSYYSKNRDAVAADDTGKTFLVQVLPLFSRSSYGHERNPL